MRKGIRIIEHMLRVDKVAEEIECVGDVAALGASRIEIAFFGPVKWLMYYDGKVEPLYDIRR